jgi:hypothetical protein
MKVYVGLMKVLERADLQKLKLNYLLGNWFGLVELNASELQRS